MAGFGRAGWGIQVSGMPHFQTERAVSIFEISRKSIRTTSYTRHSQYSTVRHARWRKRIVAAVEFSEMMLLLWGSCRPLNIFRVCMTSSTQYYYMLYLYQVSVQAGEKRPNGLFVIRVRFAFELRVRIIAPQITTLHASSNLQAHWLPRRHGSHTIISTLRWI